MSVYDAVAAVTEEIAKKGIGKDNVNHQQKFNFRGIDDVYNALAPILAKHKLCIIPYVESRSVTEKASRNGGALFYVTVDVKYTLCCGESKHEARVIGEAMDSGDKATNKAMSAAYKYLCFQTFCIPLEATDADEESQSVLAVDNKLLDEFAEYMQADNIDFLVWWAGLSEDQQSAINGSFPDGQKTKGKNDIKDKVTLGHKELDEIAEEAERYAENDDSLGALQIKELHPKVKALLAQRLSDKAKQYLREVK